MNILVVDVAAESGGGLSVLSDFYFEIIRRKNNADIWYIAVSTPDFAGTDNVKILKFPWIKKSWLHRLFFDYIYLPRLIRLKRITKVFSLQNLRIPNTKAYQVVYVHNALPFVDYKYEMKKNFYLWTYQNLIGRLIKNSIKKADLVIVQSEWMKIRCQDHIKTSKNNVLVIPPVIEKEIDGVFLSTKESLSTFFYPAGPIVFKNHEVILNACKILQNKGINDYKIIFTLSGNENANARNLLKTTNENILPIEFVGSITRKEVFEYYKKSVLLFPSMIESSPLPLSEAKLYGTPIIASDYPFSKEVLKDYKNAVFFNALDPNQLANCMEEFLIENKGMILKPYTPSSDSKPDLFKTVYECLSQERK